MRDKEVEATVGPAMAGDSEAIRHVIDCAQSSADARVLAVAAVLAGRVEWVERATGLAVTSRDRQIVAIASAYLCGDIVLVQLLARDHLSEHPDSLIVAWMAAIAS